MSNKQAEHDRLVALLNAANFAYFNGKESHVSEPVRDQLKQQLIALEAANPELISPKSPTQRVGAPLGGRLPKVPHLTRKWSLSDAFDIDELREWTTRMERETGRKIELSIEPKIDGINATLHYENGVLTRAVTRGNGQIGEDITHAIRTISGLPLTLSEPVTAELTGEVYIRKDDFATLKGEQFANPRNLAAGSVRLLDPKIISKRHLRMRVYHLGQHNMATPPATQTALYDWLQAMQIPSLAPVWVGANAEEAINFCAGFASQRDQFPFEIDGLVLKVHDLETREQIGFTAKVARGAIAWKFPPTEAVTRLKAVMWQVGRTGVLTPVAELVPVLVDGSRVSRAILHNRVDMKNKDLRLGDHVVLVKAGDVIPAIEKPLKELRDGTEKQIEIPQDCPNCTAVLAEDEMRLRCENINCSAQLQARVHWEGVGYGWTGSKNGRITIAKWAC